MTNADKTGLPAERCYREQLVALAEHAVVLDEATFTWFGQRVSVQEGAGEGTLGVRLATHLYEHFYTAGQPIPGGVRGPHGAYRMDEAFVEEIGAATFRSAPVDPGWFVTGENPRGRPIEIDGIAFIAPGSPAGPATVADIGQPMLSRRAQPGFCAVLSTAALTPGTVPMVRLYWNVIADGAAPLAGLLSRELAACGVPFVLKMVNAPAGFNRRDAAVLYVPDDGLAATLDVVARRHHDIAWALLPGVPALTKRIVHGVGAAEDPGNGESFGQHRCRLLAGALRDPAVRRSRGAERRAGKIAAYLLDAGVSPSAPYLSRGRADRLSLPTAKARRRSTPGSYGHPAQAGPPPDPLATAALIGDLLVREALWQANACTWLIPRPARDLSMLSSSARRSWSLAGGDLFAGTAGIGTFLSGLATAVDADGYARAAVGGLRHAANVAEHELSAAAAGPYLGWTGIVTSLMHAGRQLGRPELAERGERIAKRLVRQDLECPGEDWLSGLAGTIAGLLAVGRAGVDGPFTEAADRLGQTLLARSVYSRGERTWPDRRRGRVCLTGLAHGAAGIALALAELGVATGRPAYLEAAASAVAYERRCFSPARRNWPDFRPLPTWARASRSRRYAVAWCHGAPGIALARTRMWQLLGDESYRAEATLGRATALQSLSWLANAVPDQLVLCHGLAGNLRIMRILDAADAPRSPAEIASVGSAAGQLRSVAALARAAGPTSRWMRAAPSLLTGAAGIGQALLAEAGVAETEWPMLPWR